jgi:ABC-type sulfate transport system permease component
MKRKYWLIFGVVQVTGAMAAFGAFFLQFPSLLLVALLLLLPGTLASVALSRPGQVGADWSPWTLSAIAVLANVLLFTTTSFLLRRYRKSK